LSCSFDLDGGKKSFEYILPVSCNSRSQMSMFGLRFLLSGWLVGCFEV
jgi:hypothetical protein